MSIFTDWCKSCGLRNGFYNQLKGNIMTDRAEKYLLATKAYKLAGSSPESKCKLLCNELKDFMNSGEWGPAIEMLKYSGEYVALSVPPAIVHEDKITSQYVLTGYGFWEITLDKYGRPIEREFIKDPIFASEEKLTVLISSFVIDQGYSSLVTFIRNRLDTIAANCPKSCPKSV